MDADLAQYIVRFYGELMSKQERQAYKRLYSTIQATHGRSAQQEAKRGPRPLREMLSEDPDVIRLVEGGMEKFVERTAKRILHQHAERILLNHCPRCGALARTPKARQCRFCGHDWHDLGAKFSHLR